MKVATIFTRFNNKDIFESLMAPYRDSEGNILLENMDVVGYLYTDPVFDETGEMVEQPVRQEGFHVNFLNTIPEVFKKYIIPRPSTPSRVFAGDDETVEV